MAEIFEDPMADITIDGRKVHYADRGAGPPIVLLHAGASSGKQWSRIASLLESRFRLIAPDLWGMGETDAWPNRDLTHDDQADLVGSLLEILGLASVHLVGHSYGASAATRFVLMHPSKVRTLTLVEPNTAHLLKLAGEVALYSEYEEIALTFIESAASGHPEVGWARFLNYRSGPDAWSELSADARAKFLATTGNIVTGFYSTLRNSTTLEDLRGIRHDTLVVCGGASLPLDRKVTEIVRDNLSRCTYRVVPGAGHFSPVTHPQAVSELLEKHVTSVPDVTRSPRLST